MSGAENRDGERGPFCEGWGKALPNVALGTELEEQPGALSTEHSGTPTRAERKPHNYRRLDQVLN